MPDDDKPFQLTAADLGLLLNVVDAADFLFRKMAPKDALKIAVREEHRRLGDALDKLHS